MIRILLPVYNESESIYDLLENYYKFFNEHPQEHKIYIINDNSDDDTEIYITKAINNFKNLTIIYSKNEINKGLAITLKDNIKKIISESNNNDILVTMDGDNTHNPYTILLMLQKLQLGADIVIASRYCSGATIQGLSFYRIILSRFAKILYDLRWHIKGVKDYTCNYRAYKISVLNKLIEAMSDDFITETEFNGVSELLNNAAKYASSILEVPLTLNYSNKKNKSHINIIKTIFKTLKMLLYTNPKK